MFHLQFLNVGSGIKTSEHMGHLDSFKSLVWASLSHLILGPNVTVSDKIDRQKTTYRLGYVKVYHI